MEVKKMCGREHKESKNYVCHFLAEVTTSGYNKVVVANGGKEFANKQEFLIFLGRVDRPTISFTLEDVTRDKSKSIEVPQPPQAKADDTKAVKQLREFCAKNNVLSVEILEWLLTNQKVESQHIDAYKKLYIDNIQPKEQPQQKSVSLELPKLF